MGLLLAPWTSLDSFWTSDRRRLVGCAHICSAGEREGRKFCPTEDKSLWRLVRGGNFHKTHHRRFLTFPVVSKFRQGFLTITVVTFFLSPKGRVDGRQPSPVILSDRRRRFDRVLLAVVPKYGTSHSLQNTLRGLVIPNSCAGLFTLNRFGITPVSPINRMTSKIYGENMKVIFGLRVHKIFEIVPLR